MLDIDIGVVHLIILTLMTIYFIDFMYKNIFKLRKHKLMIMRQIMDTVPRNVKIVRLHELEKSPEIFIQVRILMMFYFMRRLQGILSFL